MLIPRRVTVPRDLRACPVLVDNGELAGRSCVVLRHTVGDARHLPFADGFCSSTVKGTNGRWTSDANENALTSSIGIDSAISTFALILTQSKSRPASSAVKYIDRLNGEKVARVPNDALALATIYHYQQRTNACSVLVAYLLSSDKTASILAAQPTVSSAHVDRSPARTRRRRVPVVAATAQRRVQQVYGHIRSTGVTRRALDQRTYAAGEARGGLTAIHACRIG